MTILNPSGKTPTNIRLTQSGKMLLVQLSEQMGLTQSGVMETAIRELAKREKIQGLHFTQAELTEGLERLAQAEEAAMHQDATQWAVSEEKAPIRE